MTIASGTAHDAVRPAREAPRPGGLSLRRPLTVSQMANLIGLPGPTNGARAQLLRRLEARRVLPPARRSLARGVRFYEAEDADRFRETERLRHAEVIGLRAITGGAQVGDIEYRFGYYVVGRIGRAAGRWTWGQFAPFIPREDLDVLLDKARAEGTLLPSFRGHRRSTEL